MLQKAAEEGNINFLKEEDRSESSQIEMNLGLWWGVLDGGITFLEWAHTNLQSN